MSTLIIIIVLILFNFILAAIAFSIVDKNEELLNWLFKEAPKSSYVINNIITWIIQFLIITLWPIIIYYYLKKNPRNLNNRKI